MNDPVLGGKCEKWRRKKNEINKYILTGRPLGPGFPAGPEIPCKRKTSGEKWLSFDS